MEEFWVCQHCRSLNRVGAGKCYSCRAKYGSRPKDGGQANKAAAAPAPPSAGSIPDFSATSGQAPNFSRPVALAPAAGGAAEVVRASREPFQFPSPIAAVRRRIGWSLAMRQSVSVAWLGYLTAALLALVFAMGAIIVVTVMPAATHLLQHANVGTAWAQLTAGQQGLLRTVSIALVITGLLALLCFSLFLGLSTHNATGLGADQPLLTPYDAGTCWVGVLWTQARIAVGLIVPAALIWRGYEILGLVAAIVALEIAHRHLEDFGGWVIRPGRHLPDLYAKLGVEGSMSSPMASLWSACFRIATVLAVALSALPALALTVFAALVIADRNDIVIWQATGLGPAQLGVAVLAASLVGWTAGAVALLVPITLGLVQRQRTRRTLVRVGRSRSWVARPGEGGYAPAAAAHSARYGEYDDEDRIVERVPTYGAPAPEVDGPSFGRPGFGGPGSGTPSFGRPGFGGPGLGGPGIGNASQGGPGQSDPGQASLYSPSTTSSFPWSEGPPAESD